MSIIFNSQQKNAIERTLEWYKTKNKQIWEISGIAGSGKAQPMDTVIPTPDGEKLLGDLQVGDCVFNRYGEPVKILGVFDQGDLDAYKVVFADGRSTICNDQHLWGVYIKDRTDNIEVVSTREIINSDNELNEYFIPTINDDKVAIFKIEYLGYKTPMRCIYVDDPEHLYLTNDYIVTHNTTCVYHIIEKLGLSHDEVLFMAYVGKATLALALKGNNAQTIHSTIYDIEEVPLRNELGDYILVNGRPVTRPEFIKKEHLPSNIKLLVVDEGRMVSKHIAEDLVSYGIPMIILGDHNQLDPPFGEPYFLNHPDVVLTQPMRQALDDPIFKLANMVINGEYIRRGKYGNNCFVIDTDMINDKMLTKSDIIICGRNKTRDVINRHIRYNILKRKSECPVIGDKIICRQNNWGRTIMGNIFLINGMVGYVEDVYLDTYNKHSITIDFRPDFCDFEYFKKLVVDYKALTSPYSETKSSKRSYYNKFEYGWAISTHLSQGSEWDIPLIIYEDYGTNEFKKKALYTAITRARKGLILRM